MPTTVEELEAVSKPSVLISGGGIGGLTLALLLHRANIPFLVLERAKEIKPLGKELTTTFVKRGKYVNEGHLHTKDLKPVHTMDGTWLRDAVGYGEYVISRPDLYDLLINSIPRERILLGKRVLSSIQNEDSVMVRCSDNTSYHGDILVGADGAYSAVRQNLYKILKEKKRLPASDDVVLPFSCVCLVDKESSKRNDSFRNSEWGLEAAEALAREVRPFKVPGGKDGKMNPSGGSGTITAIHDAVTHANWLSILRLPREKKVGEVFKEYRSERYPIAKAAFEASQMFNRNIGKVT
ncbi:hypothetical protein BGZ92_007948 [Podila epicladia]|nr:hypothetical protein BGZ92_007948 [Podila epicladia]